MITPAVGISAAGVIGGRFCVVTVGIRTGAARGAGGGHSGTRGRA